MQPTTHAEREEQRKAASERRKRGGFGGAIFLRASPAAKAEWRLPPRWADAARAAIRKVRARNPGNDEGGILIYPPGGTAHFHLQDIHIKREISACDALLRRKALKSERRNAAKVAVRRHFRLENRRFHAATGPIYTAKLRAHSKEAAKEP